MSAPQESDEQRTARELTEAARRLDIAAQYMSPPFDRHAARVADWLRNGREMPFAHRQNYAAAARALLAEDPT